MEGQTQVATVFKVSEKQWTKVGFPAPAYHKLVALGYQPVWKLGGGFTLHDVKNEQQWGTAKVKGDKAYPDAIFKSKYKELVGQPLVLTAFTGGQVDFSDIILGEAGPEAGMPMKTPSQVSPEKVSQIKDGVNLSNVEEVGVYVKGTSANYKVYLISDDCNIAFRYGGGQLAIRAERFSDAASKALAAWGCTPKKGDRPYASCHLNVPNAELARRTLGSLAMSVLTGPPKKLLSKEQVK